MGIKDWFKGLRKPAVSGPAPPWNGRNRRTPLRSPKVTQANCPLCGLTVSAWRTYADGSQQCLDCASKGTN
jgi:hypothetical protein